MNKLKTILICLFILPVICAAQTYLSIVPSLTNDIGSIRSKSNLSIEAGRQWDVFSLGLAIGKTNLEPKNGHDTTVYAEIRPNLNVFQQGKFTNTITPGIGYVFNAQQNLVLEFTTGIEYSYSPLIHFNIVVGQYYYSGKTTASSTNFFGLSIMKFFSPSHSRTLIEQAQKLKN